VAARSVVKASIIALSNASPTVPIDGARPAWRTRSLKAQELNWLRDRYESPRRPLGLGC